MLLVKKYPNRRLYDTQESRYITIDDLEQRIRRGADVMIQDATSGQDLTQETLTQIILQRGGGRILPASLLLRLIRLDDEALAEFLTRYVGWALEVYVGAKQRAKALLPLNPLATAPFAATDALARMMLGASSWGSAAAPPAPREPLVDDVEPFLAPPPPEAPHDRNESEIERIRRELEELKASLAPRHRPGRPAKKATKRPAKKR
jgi:polyhydroxyalkanoate synthesis repressor PhaR